MTTLIATAAASIGAFLLVFWAAGVVPEARRAVATAHGALRVVRAPDLDDVERERAVQAAALRLVRLSGSLILRSALAVVAALALVFLADWVGLVPSATTLAFLQRWDVIGISTLLIVGVYAAGRSPWVR